jgi:hypothetical protein
VLGDDQVATPPVHSSDPRVEIEYGEMMDAPVLTAIISVSGTLLGAIVGGCLTMYSNFFLNKRRERAEFRVGCRLIADELNEYEILIYALLEQKRAGVRPSWSSVEEPETNAWEKHEHVLASYLPYEAWRDVRAALQEARSSNLLAARARRENTETITDVEFALLNSHRLRIQKGQASLHPYLRK